MFSRELAVPIHPPGLWKSIKLVFFVESEEHLWLMGQLWANAFASLSLSAPSVTGLGEGSCEDEGQRCLQSARQGKCRDRGHRELEAP